VSKRVCNNNVSEYRYEYHSMPNQRKRIRKATLNTKEESKIIYNITFNGSAFVGMGAVIYCEALSSTMKILLCALFFLAGLSITQEEE
jgi:hypothetical protein